MQHLLLTSGLERLGEAALADAILGAARPFPRVDPATLWQARSRDGALRIAAVRHPDHLVGPRRYRAQEGDVAVLYTGLPADPRRRLRGHDAGDLLAHWPELPAVLEGQFAAVRIDLAGGEAQLLLDPVGGWPLFAWRGPGGCAVSTSVEALRRLLGLTAPSPVGVATYLALGWAAGGSTLLDGVEVLRAGARHDLADGRLRTSVTFTPAPRTRPGPARDPRHVAADLVATVAAAGEVVDEVAVPLTAGRDSRLVAAITLGAGVPARFYTVGEPEDVDVRLARDVAVGLGLPYERLDPGEVRHEDWRAAITRLVEQSDAGSNLGQLQDLADQAPGPDPLGLKLLGVGGEAGRTATARISMLATTFPGLRALPELQRRLLALKLPPTGTPVGPAAAATSTSFLRAFVDERRSEGWRTREIVESFFLLERVGHWAASGPRRTADTDDLLNPLSSRPFLDYCYAISFRERFVEAPHFRLLSVLSPALRDLPYEVAWEAQRPRAAEALAVARTVADAGGMVRRRLAPARAGAPAPAGAPTAAPEPRAPGERLLEEHRRELAELCLAHEESPLWAWIDRERVEALLADPEPEGRRAQRDELLRALTLLWWFHVRHDLAAAGGPGPSAR